MSKTVEIKVPDIGDYKDVEVIEVLVAQGDRIEVEDSLFTLESDKASLEIPATDSGVIKELTIKVGDRVSEGDSVGLVELADDAANQVEAEAPSDSSEAASGETPAQVAEAVPPAEPEPAPRPATDQPRPDQHQERSRPTTSPTAHIETGNRQLVHASPGVRRFARELGADIRLIKGSGAKNRILKEDVKAFIKSALEHSGSAYSGAGSAAGGAGIPPIPEVDFSKFGDVERIEIGRIQKLSAANLHRAWLNLPMVTHHDEADITELEDFRKSLKGEAEKKGLRVTGLAFHMKALAAVLKVFPKFNASLSADGQALFYKKYCHIGIAVDTPNGLVVPVFRDVDKKSIFELAEEMADISERARNKKLKPDEMQGGCMTISSLGGIGGTAFTPIVNAPEVAILGITRARMQPVWNGSEFIARLMCPFDLTYDHRVIDGADAARFMTEYCRTVSDIRRLVL
ncbi:MAG: dihydrolipoyllysine-residue acetyltransferase [Gammaproteobacteria bacterium]|nr:dihydrolipoyllysine-residue acetyltransferase [Gammaproteobacteria bacterium]